MSSNIRIVKACEFCKKEFIAKTTVTQCCSDSCAKRYYKLKKRNEKIEQAKLKTEIRKKPDVYVTPEELTLINRKITLTLKEAAVMMNISELTMRRWFSIFTHIRLDYWRQCTRSIKNAVRNVTNKFVL